MSELKPIKIMMTQPDAVGTIHKTPCDVYLKDEADKVIEKKDKEIAALKAMAKEPSVPNRTCRKCGRVGTLMYMPIVKDERTYWDLYNNKGMDYVFGIQCAHCGEVAFLTKQTHEYELYHLKYKRCMAMARWCMARYNELAAYYPTTTTRKMKFLDKWWARWLAIAEKFKPNSTAQ